MAKRALGILVILIVLLATFGAAFAWEGSSERAGLPWGVLSGGGAPATSASGHVVLNSTLGQTTVGPSAGGDYALGAGYWYGIERGGYRLYLPILMRHR